MRSEACRTVENPDLSPADARRFAVATSLLIPMVLSFVAAFVDVVCYLGVFSTFVAFITGTIIIMFTELAEPSGASLNKITALPIFLAALSVWTLLIKTMRARGYQVILHHILLVQAILLALTMVLANRFAPLPDPDNWRTVAVTGLAVFAMALQTTAMAMLLHFHTPTTMMTGNTTALMVHVWNAGSAARYWAGNPPKLPRSALIRRYAAAIVGFLSGGIAGAVGWTIAGFLALAIPVGVLAGFAAIIYAAGWNPPSDRAQQQR
ncbi:MAG: YoaK family protein [Alphaproteobacteria bacterium]